MVIIQLEPSQGIISSRFTEMRDHERRPSLRDSGIISVIINMAEYVTANKARSSVGCSNIDVVDVECWYGTTRDLCCSCQGIARNNFLIGIRTPSSNRRLVRGLVWVQPTHLYPFPYYFQSFIYDRTIFERIWLKVILTSSGANFKGIRWCSGTISSWVVYCTLIGIAPDTVSCSLRLRGKQITLLPHRQMSHL